MHRHKAFDKYISSFTTIKLFLRNYKSWLIYDDGS
jgi:hypothetical protein